MDRWTTLWLTGLIVFAFTMKNKPREWHEDAWWAVNFVAIALLLTGLGLKMGFG